MLICSLINVSGTNCANPLQIPITVESCLISQSAQIYLLQNLKDRCLKARFWKFRNLLLLSKACGFSKIELRPGASTLPGSLWEKCKFPGPTTDLQIWELRVGLSHLFSARFWHTGVRITAAVEYCISGREPWDIQCTFIRRLEETLSSFLRKILSCFLASPLSQGQQKPGMCVSCPHSHHGEFSPTDLQKPGRQLAVKILSCQGPHGYSGAGRSLWIPSSWSGAWISQDNHCGLITRVTTHRLILPQHKTSIPPGSCQTLWPWTLYCPDFIGNESQLWLHIRIT